MNHWRSASKHARFANIPRTSTFVHRWTHTPRINYACWLMNNAHQCTVVSLNFVIVQNSKSRTNHLRRISTYNHRQITYTTHALPNTKICAWFVRDSCIFAVWLALYEDSIDFWQYKDEVKVSLIMIFLVFCIIHVVLRLLPLRILYITLPGTLTNRSVVGCISAK